MGDRRPNIPELAAMLLSAFPKFDDTKQRVALATYRRLARGIPASLSEIAVDAGADLGEVRRILGDWVGVYADADGRVVAFWGLAIPTMKHVFEVDGVRLHTWCAFDTLFLPELLEKTASVESTCETSGEAVRLIVAPTGVESAEPASMVLSFLEPDACRFQADVIKNFCHFVHFFRSREDGARWIEKNPGTFLLTLDEAVDLARRKNAAQFGDLLPRRAASPVITLIFDAACPNVSAARSVIRDALHRTGLDLRWGEHQVDAADVPERFRQYGSPTILVDGIDVAGEREPAMAAACRVYPSEGRLRGIPPLETIVAAITRAIESRSEEGADV